MPLREALYRQIPIMFLKMHDILGNKIVAGEFDVAPFPNEAELAKQFKSTLHTAREVIELLAAKGLLASRRGQLRPAVQSSEFWNLIDPDVLRWLHNRPMPSHFKLAQHQMRLAIQPAAAALAAKRRDISRTRFITLALGALRTSKTFDNLLEADVAFQVAILEASLNPMFARLKSLIHAETYLADEYFQQIRNGSFIDISQYVSILNAIETGDHTGAEEAMRSFLQNRALSIL